MTNDSKTHYPLRDTGKAVIEPGTEPYYDRLSLDTAVIIAQEMIDEWNYEADPHGYCHERPVLLRLVEAVQRGVEWGGGRDD